MVDIRDMRCGVHYLCALRTPLGDGQYSRGRLAVLEMRLNAQDVEALFAGDVEVCAVSSDGVTVLKTVSLEELREAEHSTEQSTQAPIYLEDHWGNSWEMHHELPHAVCCRMVSTDYARVVKELGQALKAFTRLNARSGLPCALIVYVSSGTRITLSPNMFTKNNSHHVMCGTVVLKTMRSP